MRGAITACSLFLLSFLIPSPAEAQYKEISRQVKTLTYRDYKKEINVDVDRVVVYAKINYKLNGEIFEKEMRKVQDHTPVIYLGQEYGPEFKIHLLMEKSRHSKNIEDLVLGRVGQLRDYIFSNAGYKQDIEKQISKKRGDLSKYQDDLETEVLMRVIETGKEFCDIGQIEKQYGFESTQGLWSEFDEKVEGIISNLANKSKALSKERKTRKELVEILNEKKKEEISFLILDWLSQIRTFSDSQLERILCYGDYEDIDFPFWGGSGYIAAGFYNFTIMVYGTAASEYANRAKTWLYEKNWDFNNQDIDEMTSKGLVLLNSIDYILKYSKEAGDKMWWSRYFRELFNQIKTYRVSGRLVVSPRDQEKIEEIKEFQSTLPFNRTRGEIFESNTEKLKIHQ